MLSVIEFANKLNITKEQVKQLLQSCGVVNVSDSYMLTEKDIANIFMKLTMGETKIEEKKSDSTQDLEVLFGEDTRTFIDTNILLEDNFYDFWDRLEPLVIRHRSIKVDRIPIIPYKVCEELLKMSNSDNERGRKAPEVLKFIKKLKDKQLVKIMGDPQSDNFADNVFKTVFTQYRLKYNMILITQDKGLTEDILQLNNAKADRAKKVQVFKLLKDSTIMDAIEYENARTKSKANTSAKKGLIEKPKFEIKTTPISRKDEVLKVASFPKEGDMVYTKNASLKLVSTVSETGGEGMVYKTDRGDICKIYHPNKLTLNRKDKIELMIKNRIDYPGVCWPTEAVYNSSKEFVGYIMPEAKGTELEKLIKVKPILQKTFPNWTKKEMVQLCITILEKFVYLHHHNIILGDINARNILVVSEKEVYFVDVDSYQVGKYPCEVGWPHFTAPELIGKDMSKFMRTMGNENFAIATLLFMIMIPGKPPYAQMGSGTPEADIKRMVFAYPKGAEKKGVVAPGQWRFCWSHLSYDLKEAFYNTFQGGEAYNQEEDRLSSKDWLDRMKKYQFVLDMLIENDEQSGWIFPNDYKKHKSVTYANCKICNSSVKEEDLTEGYCRTCLREGEKYHCTRCNAEMTYTNLQKYIKKKPKYNECYDCRKQLDEVVKEIECKGCGCTFDFTLGEKEYYDSKGYDYPKRCSSCRENNVPIKRQENENPEAMGGVLDILKCLLGIKR